MKNKKEVIIVYENIVREYDNALLLKAELTRRGYRVKILYKLDMLFRTRKNVIYVLPNCYNDVNYDAYKYRLNAQFGSFVSMQYEQVLSKRIEKTEVHIPKGKAKEIELLSWGNNCYQRLLQKGIDKERMRICGAVQLDFLREEFEGFYLNRHEMARKYNLDENKKWLLYISSFSYVDNAIITKYTALELNDNDFVREFTELSTKSQKDTLDWFEQMIRENDDIIIIYRKHPVESKSVILNRLVKKYPEKFRDISELSVKQWIYASDLLLTWFSTSAAEAYMAKKPLLLIRPYPIKEEYDVPFYYGVDSISSLEELRVAIKGENNENNFQVSKDIMYDYYEIGEVPAYVKVADALEALFAKNAGMQRQESAVFGLKRLIVLKKEIVKYCIKKVYQYLYITFSFQIKNEKLRKSFAVPEWEDVIRNEKDEINVEKYLKLKEITERIAE